MAYASAHLAAPASGNQTAPRAFFLHNDQTRRMGAGEGHMKGVIAWFMGVPLVVIVLLYFFDYF